LNEGVEVLEIYNMKEEGFRVTNIDDDNEINVVIQPLSKLSSGDTLPNELDLVK